MSEAACAEEEEGLKRLAGRAYTLGETIRRVETGDLIVGRDAINKSRDYVIKALAMLDEADKAIMGGITGCRGCPT